MNKEIYICPVCGHSELALFLDSEDYFLSREQFSIKECPDCGLKITSPVPPENEIQRYYESPEYISHDAAAGDLLSRIYKLVRKFSIRFKYGLVKKHATGKKVLDIGCGTGEFLNFCATKGYECHGVEPNEKARNFAIRENGLEVRELVSFSKEDLHTFSCITLWHVLEHIPDLDKTMDQLRELLEPGGLLIIALPNPGSWDSRHYGKFWAAFDLPRHLYHFSAKAFTRLAEKHHFAIEKIVPQKLDSFYISLLSEKYKRGGRGNLLLAFLNGIRSNLHALTARGGYSSQIFLLRNKNS